jgi:hypothetical protein
MSADLEELHDFARLMGIKRCWFDGNKRHPHYDLTGDRPQRVLEVLAPISTKEMLKKVRNASN